MRRLWDTCLVLLVLFAANSAKGSDSLRFDPATEIFSLRSFLEIAEPDGHGSHAWMPYRNLFQLSFADHWVWMRFKVFSAQNQPMKMIFTNEFRVAGLQIINLNHLSPPLYGGFRYLETQAVPWLEPSMAVTVYPGDKA